MAFLPLWPMICFVKIILPTLLKTCIEQRGRMAFLPLWPICPAVVNTEVRNGTSLGASGLKRGKQCVRAFKIRRKHGGKLFFVKVTAPVNSVQWDAVHFPDSRALDVVL